MRLRWVLRYTERFQVRDERRSSSEEIPRPSEDETLDVMQSLIPAENIGSRERRGSSTALFRHSDLYQERDSFNLSTEDAQETRGAAFYDSNFCFENTSTITNPRFLNTNNLSSIKSMSSLSQTVEMTDSLSTAIYQRNSLPTTTTTTYGADSTSLHPSRGSSSSFTFGEVSNINNSDILDLYPFPQPQSFNMLTGSLPATTFDQIFPNTDYGDALAYPTSFSEFHDGRIIRERRTEPLLPSSSPKRQCGPLGILNTHPFSPQQQEQCTPSMTSIELHPRSIKRR